MCGYTHTYECVCVHIAMDMCVYIVMAMSVFMPFPSPGDLPNPGIEPGSPALQADALLSEPPGKSHIVIDT